MALATQAVIKGTDDTLNPTFSILHTPLPVSEYTSNLQFIDNSNYFYFGLSILLWFGFGNSVRNAVKETK